MSRLVVVGCGTVVPEGDRACSSFWIELGGARLLMDCGPGAVQALARLQLPWAELSHLLITHFHADHVGAIPGLLFSLKWGLLPQLRAAPLEVVGPPGTRRLFVRLGEALGDFVLDPGFPVRISEIAPGGARELIPGLRLSAHKTPHTEESVALRLDGAGASVGYTGDTGPDDSLGPFFHGTDLLVAECSLTDEAVGPNHLSPSTVARLAAAAEPGRLLLTHVWPQVRARFDVPALVRAAGFGGEVELAREGWWAELGSGAGLEPARGVAAESPGHQAGER